MRQNQTFLRCACAQIDHTPDQPELLIQAHERAIAEAETAAVDLLVFPEASLTGYPASMAHVRAAAIPRTHSALLQLAQMCQQCTAVVGFVEHGADGQYYNAIAWLHRGQVLAVHRKINLPTYGRLREGTYFAKGQQTTRMRLPSGYQCGGLICADFWDPGLAYLSALARDMLLVVPFASTREAVGSGFSNEDGWQRICANHALIYGMPLLACNWAGQLGADMRFWGGSAIYDAKGHKAVEAGDRAETIVTDLSVADIHDARARLPTIRDLSPDLLMQEIPILKAHLNVAS
ncbi:hypothetical protein N6L24_14665 [Cognatishimia sp. SS12]|uniref:nitrilase-related carbon-nitrogen hydrolase n=1 Tax=Cognatishimia sp. SS12 TaxID=2979465 RepID=UPI0023306EDE|nr:nitrilase-related carbon-nitrogen hydrolase [Cognatishimia sp. SS12]MDC0739529.1 hypothetical protein [Cognatishimia sp. SS12]